MSTFEFFTRLHTDPILPDPVKEDAAKINRDELRIFEDRLRNSIENQPVESCVSHPAQLVIEDAIGQKNTNQVLKLLKSLVLEFDQSSFSASLLLCLGRTQIGTPLWRSEIIRGALTSSDLEIRDAAVQAAESWEGNEMLEILQNHTESVQWLSSYIKEVIEYWPK